MDQHRRAVPTAAPRARLLAALRRFGLPAADRDQAAAIHKDVKRLQREVRRVERFAQQRHTHRLEVGRLDFPDADIYLRLTTPFELLRLRACASEPWTVDWLRRSVRPGDVVYDVGANVGAFSFVAAHCAPDVRCVAFEPGGANYAALSENIALNGLGDRVTALPIALG